MSLNLALVLDVSGSMYEEDGTGVSRLQRIQEAAIAAREITPKDLYARRREFIKLAGVTAAATFAGVFGLDDLAESAIPGDKLTIAGAGSDIDAFVSDILDPDLATQTGTVP